MSVSSAGTDEVDSTCHTPTQSTISDIPQKASPYPGGIYKIVDPDSRHVIAIQNGLLALYPEAEVQGDGSKNSWHAGHWLCMNNCGWLRFLNTASGKYIECDELSQTPNLISSMRGHSSPAHFVTRTQDTEEGEYVLMIKFRDKLFPIVTDEQDKTVLTVGDIDKKGKKWQFIQVQNLY